MAKKNQKGGSGAPKQSKEGFQFEGKRFEEVKQNGSAPEPRLRTFYNEKVIPALMKRFEYTSVMQVPKLEKISLNMGVGEANQDPKVLQHALNQLELITGQRPAVRKAKHAISNFKLRQGQPIGCMVTLRRSRMWEFLDRFINISAPRIRDFRGFSDKSFDGRGNYSIGIKEQIIFPEIDVDKVPKISGLDLTFVFRSGSDEESYAFLSEFGFPFRKKGNE